jgi:anti-sigma regulatory factor (Ser/Thr protein kinase)
VLDVRGGRGAPRRAREQVAAFLDGLVDGNRRYRVLLLVSELVTNSVVHAGVGPSGSVRIDVCVRDGALRIAVVDHGSGLVPQMRAPEHERGGGIGLYLVDQTTDEWGVEVDAGARTEVWFKIDAN